jgi:hypothetical protein
MDRFDLREGTETWPSLGSEASDHVGLGPRSSCTRELDKTARQSVTVVDCAAPANPHLVALQLLGAPDIPAEIRPDFASRRADC